MDSPVDKVLVKCQYWGDRPPKHEKQVEEEEEQEKNFPTATPGVCRKRVCIGR